MPESGSSAISRPAVRLTKLAKTFAATIRLRGAPDGAWVDATGAGTIEVTDPATTEVLGAVPAFDGLIAASGRASGSPAGRAPLTVSSR